MSSNTRFKEFTELASKKGFTVNILGTTGGGHFEAEIKSAAGVVFNAFLPKTSSDRRGRLNWVASLKKLEEKASKRNQPMIHQTPNTLSRANKQLITSTLAKMAENTDFLILSYMVNQEKGSCQYYFNDTRVVSRKDALPSFVFNYLFSEGYIMLTETINRKQIFSLTSKGYKAGSHLAKESTPMEALPVSAPLDKTMQPQTQVNLWPAVHTSGASLSERDELIQKSVGHLSLDDLKSVLYYGLEFWAESEQNVINKLETKIQLSRDAARRLV